MQVATQELQAEKARMQEWKANVMQEVASHETRMKRDMGTKTRPLTRVENSTKEIAQGQVKNNVNGICRKDKIFAGAKTGNKSDACVKYTCHKKSLAGIV